MMSEFSHAPTESPERRAASLAASRTSGGTPFTCQGTYLMLTPRLGFGQVSDFRPLGRPAIDHGICANRPQPLDPDFLRITVKSELIQARFGTDISPQSERKGSFRRLSLRRLCFMTSPVDQYSLRVARSASAWSSSGHCPSE